MPSEDRQNGTIPEVEDLLARAKTAQAKYEEFSQAEVDAVVKAVAEAMLPRAEELARLAVEETGFGRVEDKIIKNRIASGDLYNYIKDMKTVGIIATDETSRIAEVAAPYGVVLAIIPSTNPTSTAIYKALISLKSRNTVVFSPHPSAAKCINYTAELIGKAASAAGAPDGLTGCVKNPTMEATQALMTHPKTNLILATGGMGLVRAAYSAGKPAYGVGPGNVPAYIDRTADIDEAVRCVLTGKTFDWGTVCSSEQSIIADSPIYDEVVRCLKARKAYICSQDETGKLEKTMVRENLAVNPEIVGKSPAYIAEKAGFTVPADTTALVCPYQGIGRDYPLSIEKLSPVLTLFRAEDWKDGCRKSIQVLEFGGLGHSISIHSRDEAVIREFALKKPASRILVNTASTHGAIGISTNLPISLTLGCGPLGGNITSDNITPLHLVTIKRLAYGVHYPESTIPALKREAQTECAEKLSTTPEPPLKSKIRDTIDRYLDGKTAMGRLIEEVPADSTKKPWEPVTPGDKKMWESFDSAQDRPFDTTQGEPPGDYKMSEPVSLGSAQDRPPGDKKAWEPACPAIASASADPPGDNRDNNDTYDFVCEADVQRAMIEGRQIRIHKGTIITPLAHELGKSLNIFIEF